MGQTYYHICDNQFNEAFDKVKLLARYPWVGSNYANNDYHLLIIGDSHYAVDKNGAFSQPAYDEFKDKNSTRSVINWVINDICTKNSTWNMFNGLLKMFNKDKPNSVVSFFSNVAYYNFVQEVMRSSHQKPSEDDFAKAWECFYDFTDVLKPDFCLFIGVRSETNIRRVKALGGCYEIKDDIEKINRTRPRYGKVGKSSESKIPFIAIKHTSKYFSPEKWRKYLMYKEPDLRRFFNSDI